MSFKPFDIAIDMINWHKEFYFGQCKSFTLTKMCCKCIKRFLSFLMPKHFSTFIIFLYDLTKIFSTFIIYLYDFTNTKLLKKCVKIAKYNLKNL
jgi:hypothetical protein